MSKLDGLVEESRKLCGLVGPTSSVEAVCLQTCTLNLIEQVEKLSKRIEELERIGMICDICNKPIAGKYHIRELDDDCLHLVHTECLDAIETQKTKEVEPHERGEKASTRTIRQFAADSKTAKQEAQTYQTQEARIRTRNRVSCFYCGKPITDCIFVTVVNNKLERFHNYCLEQWHNQLNQRRKYNE